jgi:hypothetical protein
LKDSVQQISTPPSNKNNPPISTTQTHIRGIKFCFNNSVDYFPTIAAPNFVSSKANGIMKHKFRNPLSKLTKEGDPDFAAVDINSLIHFICSLAVCTTCQTKLTLGSIGFQVLVFKLQLICDHCDMQYVFHSSNTITTENTNNPPFEINYRMAVATMLTGHDWTRYELQFKSAGFGCYSKRGFHDIMNKVEEVSKNDFENQMKETREAIVSNNLSQSMDGLEIEKKRKHSQIPEQPECGQVQALLDDFDDFGEIETQDDNAESVLIAERTLNDKDLDLDVEPEALIDSQSVIEPEGSQELQIQTPPMPTINSTQPSFAPKTIKMIMFKKNGIAVSVVFDCRWTNPRGYNSEEATVTCIDAATGRILYREHLVRRRKDVNRYYNYVGSARGMEGAGVERILKKMTDDGFVISHYAHDDDAGTRNLVSKYFPDAIESRCVGHAAKAFRKDIQLASKDPDCGGLLSIAQSAYRWLLVAVLNAMTDESEPERRTIALKKNLDCFLGHVTNDHKDCKHKMPYTKDSIVINANFLTLRFYSSVR